MTASELGKIYDEDKSAVVEIANKANFKQFIFKCRAKYEMYNVITMQIVYFDNYHLLYTFFFYYFQDENRLKTVGVKVDPICYKEYNSYLISKINERLAK